MTCWIVDKLKYFSVTWPLLDQLNGWAAQAFGRNATAAPGSEAIMSAPTLDAPQTAWAPRRREATSPWLVLVLVGLAQFMVILDATVVNVALPSIQRALHFSTSDLQWVVNGYTLAFGGFLLLGGRAADLFGRRRLFLIGVAVFSAASLLNGLAGSAAVLVAGRALQGLGGALVAPASLSIITTTFAEGSERTRALGVWSAIAVGGGAIGLLLGGVLTQLASWQWVFFVNVPVGAAAFALSLRFGPESRAARITRGIDIGGAVAITAGLLVLVYAIVNAQSAGWVSAQTVGLGSLAVMLIATFVLIESRHRSPLIRLSLLRKPSLAGADLVMLLVAAGMFAMFFFASLYVQNVLGYSPLRAGLAFLPVTACIIIGAGLSQQLIKRAGVRVVAGIGMALAATGLVVLSRIPVDGTYVANLLPGLLTMALGMGLTFVPITLIATTNVDAEDAGLASGLLNTAQMVGGALGLAILATLAADRTASALAGLGHVPLLSDRASALVSGFQLAFLVAAFLIGAGVLVLAALVRRRHVELIDTAATPALAA
jgi:EmrB/QacA subfamily drug resistance transporter